MLDIQPSTIADLVVRLLECGSSPQAIGIAVSTLVADISADHALIRRSRSKHAEAQAKYMKNKKKAASSKESGADHPLIIADISADNPSISSYVKPMYVETTEVKKEASNVEIKKEMVNHNSIKDTELSRTRTRARKKITNPDEVFFDDWPSDYGEQFWKAYPKKNQKTKVVTLLAKIRLSGQVSWSELISGLERYRANLPEWQSWCWPTKWLEEERWNSNPIEDKNGRKSNGSGVLRSADKLIETIKRFEAGSGDIAIRSGTCPPHVRLLPER